MANNTNNNEEVLKRFNDMRKDSAYQAPEAIKDRYESFLISELNRREGETKKATALQIVNDLVEMQEKNGNSDKGTLMAIQWGIMKGWGIEPEDLKSKYLSKEK